MPEKFKVGSDASPLHCELSFPSPPPSQGRVSLWGVQNLQGGGSQGSASSPCLEASGKCCVPRTSCSGAPCPHGWCTRRRPRVCRARKQWRASISESVNKHFWSPFCVSPGWMDSGREDGQASVALTLRDIGTSLTGPCRPPSTGEGLGSVLPTAGGSLDWTCRKGRLCVHLHTEVSGPHCTLVSAGTVTPRGRCFPRKTLRDGT